MTRFIHRSRTVITLALLAGFAARTVTPMYAATPSYSRTLTYDKSPVTLRSGSGAIDLSGKGASPFVLNGSATRLGQFAAHGEVGLVPGFERGTQLGQGVVVLKAQNGDTLVGVTYWALDDWTQTGQMKILWRDAVQLSDGTVVSSNGQFTDPGNRPPSAIVALEYLFLATIVGIALVVGFSN